MNEFGEEELVGLSIPLKNAVSSFKSSQEQPNNKRETKTKRKILFSELRVYYIGKWVILGAYWVFGMI